MSTLEAMLAQLKQSLAATGSGSAFTTTEPKSDSAVDATTASAALKDFLSKATLTKSAEPTQNHQENSATAARSQALSLFIGSDFSNTGAPALTGTITPLPGGSSHGAHGKSHGHGHGHGGSAAQQSAPPAVCPKCSGAPGQEAAPAQESSDEVNYMRSEMVRLMKDLNAARKEVQILKQNGNSASGDGTQSQSTGATAVQSAAQNQTDSGTVPQPAQSAPTAASIAPTVNFPWKRHISSVEDAIRKKNNDVAESALNVLCDISEVIAVDPPARARLLTQLGTIKIDKCQFGEAEETLKKAMALLEATNSQKTLAGAACLDALAQCHQVKEQLDEAEKLRRQAVIIAEEALGAEHPDVGFFRERLETLRQDRAIAMVGNDEGSRTILDKLSAEYNEAVANGTAGAPATEPAGDNYSGFMFEKFLANAKNALAQKNVREAESALRSALEKSAAVPNNDPRKCEGLRLLAQVLEQQGKDVEAKKFYEDAATLAFKYIGWNDIQLAHCLRSLALMHARIDDFGTGKNYYKQAIAAFITISGKDDPVTVELENNYKEFIDRLKQERQWKGWAQ